VLVYKFFKGVVVDVGMVVACGVDDVSGFDPEGVDEVVGF